MHGCLLQAKLLLETNTQTVDTVTLLDTLLPLLQSTLPLMHPDQPCGPIRNEVTLLAAAVVALPSLPQTPAMACLLRSVRQLCWLAVAHSCQGHSHQGHSVRPDARAEDVNAEDVSGEDEHAEGDATDSMVLGRSSGNGPSQSCKQQPDVKARGGAGDSMSQGHSSGVAAGTPVQCDTPDPLEPLQCGGADPMTPLQCDDTDPMVSLWLKNATLLLFGRNLHLALSCAGPGEEGREACGLREEEVQTALQSRSYDVRAAVLKACTQRVTSGIFAAAMFATAISAAAAGATAAAAAAASFSFLPPHIIL